MVVDVGQMFVLFGITFSVFGMMYLAIRTEIPLIIWITAAFMFLYGGLIFYMMGWV